MGEIFRRETAEHPEPFTGERLTSCRRRPGADRALSSLSVRPLARVGLDVLDVGERRRLWLGAARAGRAVGGRRRAFRADRARRRRQFLRAPICSSCRAMRARCRSPMPASTAVVSFETIEHFDRQDDFLREVRRVLRPDGSFIVSTPDRDVYSPAGSPANPFHVHELNRSRIHLASAQRPFATCRSCSNAR